MQHNLEHFFTRILPATIVSVYSGIALASSPPSTPSSISVSANSNGTIVIQWSESYDSDGWIRGYDLLKNNNVIHVGSTTSYTDTNITSGEIYNYAVVAIDNDGNRSGASAISSAAVSTTTVTSSSNPEEGKPDFGINTNTYIACVDVDGDGWGWNGVQSCVPITNVVGNVEIQIDNDLPIQDCVDPDGDGWGWDGFQSCIANTTVVISNQISDEDDLPFHDCVDTDGDGWGWDGSKSCNVDVLVTPANTAGCFNANSINAGSNVLDFCFVETADGNVSISTSAESCVDPDGDGYGWNGFATCDPTAWNGEK